MLEDFGIEIGTSFGPLHGRVWRIGTMGHNARKDAVLTTLAALEQVLRGAGATGDSRGRGGAPPARSTRERPERGREPQVLARCDELARVSATARRDRAGAPLGRAPRGPTTWSPAGCARPGSPPGRTPPATSAGAGRARGPGCRRCCSAPTSTPSRTPAGTTGCSAWSSRSRWPSGSGDRVAELPFALEVVGFSDEEGTRFGKALLGSSALAGQWEPPWWDLRDADGSTLREAFVAFGLDPDAVGEAARRPEELVGYLEAHIEQGPLLEAADASLGYVTTIAGAHRFTAHRARGGPARRRARRTRGDATPWSARRR